MATIYNSTKVENPPMDLEQLEQLIREQPGKFTFSNDFTGMTLLKSWLIHFAGGSQSLSGPFNQDKYQKASRKLWDYINRNKKYFWNKGETFPSSIAQLHQLFANGEVYFTFSNNDCEVDNKINQGVFDNNAMAYVPKIGSIQNSHYLGIPKLAKNKHSAMLAINFLISEQAQFAKIKPSVWGDGTVLDIQKLSEEWQIKFREIPGRKNAPDRDLIKLKALQEPAPEYMIRLFEDFRKEVISQ
jgi:putative spermidine/putrescine transport system substrate-binding protein